ncbi:hypothetical protein LEMLEM_LOCUS18824, partial [Lemmus lemmus]
MFTDAGEMNFLLKTHTWYFKELQHLPFPAFPAGHG